MLSPEALRWRVNRLRCMSAAEIVHRTQRAVHLQAASRGWVRPASAREPDLSVRSLPWVHAAARVDPAPYLEAADRYAQDRIDLFALKDVDVGSPPRWNRDPTTGIEAPLEYGMLLDYRDAARVGDCKFVWELNRHLHFVTLAQAYALTGEMRYAQAIARHVRSWVESCPRDRGINWSSSNEAGLRLMNWSVAWQLLGGVDAPIFDGHPGRQLRGLWLRSVYEQAQFIRSHFSRFSSANNHLIGEAAGLFVAAVTWPHWREAAQWRDEARAILEAEVVKQNAADGVNLEQAFSYQQYELDLLLLPFLAARANAVPLQPAYGERLRPMLEFLAAVMDAGHHVPMVGDSDDGCVVRFVPRESDPQGPFCRYRSVLATGALLFDSPALKAKAGALDDKTRWLLGENADPDYAALPPPDSLVPARRAFPEGGYYILGAGFGGADEIRLVADAGPLGYEAIAAHGHADALAFTLSVGGHEYLVDPGTYAYHTKPAWRAYFRGTSAHNTVRIDGLDQSQSGGNFLWLRQARATCTRWSPGSDRDVFEGRHDGYEGLPDPVRHKRRIVLDKEARRIVVEDTLEMLGEHAIELFFHASEDCRIEAEGKALRLSRPEGALVIHLPEHTGATTRIHVGEVDPPLGWVSRRFDVREAAPTIAWRARMTGRSVLRTTIDCGDGLTPGSTP